MVGSLLLSSKRGEQHSPRSRVTPTLLQNKDLAILGLK
jgi:hypothetical protein